MKRRCKDQERKEYGAKGISVCSSWEESYYNFLRDMGPRPEGHTLERKENDKGYGIHNCIWATPKAQANNRTSNVILTLDGVTKSITAWSEALGVNVQTLFYRKRAGWSDEAVLTEPLKRAFAGNQW